MPVIDIHTHCAPRVQGDPFGVAEALRGTPVGRNTVTNYRGLPAVSYHEMSDFDLQQEVCAKAGITGRIISNPFAAEVMTAVSTKPAIDVVKHVNDRNRRDRGALAEQLGPRHAQPARCQPPRRRRALSRRARLQGPADLVELARPLHRRRGGVCVLGMGAGPAGADLHPSAAGADRARPADGSVQARRAGRPAVRHRHGAGAHDPVRAVRPLSAAQDRGRAHGRRTAAGAWGGSISAGGSAARACPSAP